jgi:3-dehydroquinate synthase
VQTLSVSLGERSYPILIGSGLLGSPAVLASHIPAGELLLVSNTIVAPLYAERLKAALPGRRHDRTHPARWRAAQDSGHGQPHVRRHDRQPLGRDAVILALGGGVIGDLAGFVAACYQRGVSFVQLPSTLLADVDSSVGGKTAVNHPGGKNMIGAFHQPRAVIVDTDLLASLPERELRAGLAEVIKYGLIWDAAFFDWIEAHLDALLARDAAALEHAIHRSCQIKAEIVSHDEREQGERALLNFGHTFGHAIEAATGYVEWLHGEAVGMGHDAGGGPVAAPGPARRGRAAPAGGIARARRAARGRAAYRCRAGIRLHAHR